MAAMTALHDFLHDLGHVSSDELASALDKAKEDCAALVSDAQTSVLADLESLYAQGSQQEKAMAAGAVGQLAGEILRLLA